MIRARLLSFVAAMVFFGCATTGALSGGASVDALKTTLSAADRAPNDLTIDLQRKTPELLAWAGVGPDMTVVEMIAGGGHGAEALSRVVGEKGKVYALNPSGLLDLKPVSDLWNARMGRYRNENLIRLDNADLTQLSAIPDASVDLVWLVLNYHDLPWLKVDAAAMNKAVLRVLKQGGAYIVIDHSAKVGASSEEALKFHRSEEATVTKQIKEAGFTLSSTSDLLRNADDTRDWDDNPFVCADRCGKSDRYALKFIKP